MPLGDSITYGCLDGCGGNLTNPGCEPCMGGYRTGLSAQLTARQVDFTFVGSVQAGPTNISRNNEGHPGWRIDQVQAQITGWMAASKPDYILIHLGTNDAGQGYNTSTLQVRMQLLLQTIFAANPKTITYVASVIHFYCNDAAEAIVESFNAALPGIVAEVAAKGFPVKFIDMFNLSGLVQSDYGDNCVHPNAVGYKKMANVWNMLEY